MVKFFEKELMMIVLSFMPGSEANGTNGFW